MQAGHFVRELSRLGFQLGARHSPLHHAELPRALAVYPVASQDDARGHRGPCDPRQPLRSTTAWKKPEPNFGQTKLGLVGSNAQIAAERQLVATTHGRATDFGQAHLRKIGNALEQLLEWPRGLRCGFHLVRRGEARGDLGEIGPTAEDREGGANVQYAPITARSQIIQDGMEARKHFRVEGVHWRPIERNRGNPLGDLKVDQIAHRSSPWRSQVAPCETSRAVYLFMRTPHPLNSSCG